MNHILDTNDHSVGIEAINACIIKSSCKSDNKLQHHTAITSLP